MINQLVQSVQLACEHQAVASAVQRSLRLARLQNDVYSFAYFLVEFSGPDAARGLLQRENLGLGQDKSDAVFVRALDRFFEKRVLSNYESGAMKVGKDGILSFTSQQIENQIVETRNLVSSVEAKITASISPTQIEQYFSIKTMATAKLFAIERIKGSVLSECFLFSSLVESQNYFGKTVTQGYIQILDRISAFLIQLNPDLNEQFRSAITNFSSTSPEERSHALTSVRRLIESLADHISPPQDQNGLEKEKYLNRLQFRLSAAIDEKRADLNKKQLEERLRYLHLKSNKGVHSVVTQFEAHQSTIILLEYLLAIASVVDVRR